MSEFEVIEFEDFLMNGMSEWLSNYDLIKQVNF